MTTTSRHGGRTASAYAWIVEHAAALGWVEAAGWLLLSIMVTASVASPWDIVASVLGALVLGLRRFRPGLALVTAWLCAGALMATGQVPSPFPIMAIMIAVTAATRRGSAPVRRWTSASVIAGSVIAGIYLAALSAQTATGTTRFGTELLMYAVLTGTTLGAAWLLGTLGATRDRYRERTVETTIARRNAAASRERADLARDMHDVLAHSLTVMVSLADGARLSAKDLPPQTADSLREISGVGRAALTDVRTLLARLRTSEGPQYSPTTTIDGLIGDMRAVGLTIVVAEDGDPPSESSAVRRTIVHLLREALTNALRHGDRDQPVLVRLRWPDAGRDAGVVGLLVRNTIPAGARTPTTGTGHWGIMGMRERVELVGGTMTCGGSGGDWVLDVSLPADTSDTPLTPIPTATKEPA